MKLLLWAALIACAIWILRKKATLRADAGASHPRRAVAAPETMLTCAHCGVHFPASEAAVDASGAVFCGDEHRRLHASR
ncbi:MAG TPA: PP0621 family protein [Oxalicibacterium sp.]|nr:PP0621 family protein [Oxalicibacterium sp.]